VQGGDTTGAGHGQPSSDDGLIGFTSRATGLRGAVALMSDFYGTAAQVLAIVVLALVWESGYFEKLRTKTFPHSGWWRWTRTKVRMYSVTAAVLVLADLALCLAVLAGVWNNSTALRIIVGAGVGLALGTLLFRMISHIMGWDSS
jgi:hypothetical protein